VTSDGRFAVRFYLGQLPERRNLIVVGPEFEGLPDAGEPWIRVRCPEWVDQPSVPLGFGLVGFHPMRIRLRVFLRLGSGPPRSRQKLDPNSYLDLATTPSSPGPSKLSDIP
jgi:hypothetical protein